MIEPARAIAWDITQLKASTAFTAAVPGGIHEGVAPAGTDYPHCVIAMQSPGADVTAVAKSRTWAEPQISVAVWGLAENGWGPLIAGADAIDAALNQARGTTDDAEIVASWREQAIMRTVVENGVTYSVLGGLYRQQVRSLV